jgi:hypothetical protein
MQNATFLFATGYFARLCLSSHLIPFNYKATTKNAGVPGHRNSVVFFTNTLSQFDVSAVQAPFRSNALAEKLNTIQMAQKSIRAPKFDILGSIERKNWTKLFRVVD